MFSCSSDNQPESTGSPGCLCCRGELQSLTRRISADLSRRGFVAGIGASVAALGLPRKADAQAASGPTPPIVLTNFLLFDGKSNALRGGLALIVQGGRIKAVATGDTAGPEGARTIDCGGRVVMPGLIDAHWHCVFAALPIATLFAADVGYIFLAASAEAERTLMRGFTTVRDLGGPSFALKQAIDEGLVAGPRIYPCGAMITTTGGHGDMRPLSDLPRTPGGPVSAMERTGAANIADSADEVRLRVREQLLQGASQIKLVGGGGVSSPRTTLDMLTFSEPELRAGVEAAADRNTYVAAHAYPSVAIQRALAAGVVGEEDTVPLSGQSRINLVQVIAGTNTAYPLAKAHKLKTAFGSDMLFSPEKATRQGIMLTHLTRWYENAEILKMATGSNGELLALSGPRNPYPGKLGVIEEGAFADLIVVDGDPVANIALVQDPEKNFVLIMKDGKIFKETLRS
jgi:imidazolonepropionase-like amidohydrolase